jgi:Mg2+ and Co2+ transporter CorA
MFEELIYWTGTLTNEEIALMEKDHRLLAKKALVLICSNWLTTLEYATTRITQIEWEIEKPTLRLLPKSLEASLKRLHQWRRVLPIYHGMVSDTLRKVIKREHFLLATDSQISELWPDFESVLDKIAALQTRSEKIVSLVTAMISIEESQKAVQQNENLTRVTYLACVFIPLSFLSSLFSMQGDLDQLKKTFWIYFVIAVPLTVVSLLLIRFVYSNRSNFWKATRPQEPV